MFDVLVILGLVLVNGILAGAEMAIVTVRRARLESLAADGDRRARAALKLRASPERFLATIQIGITLVGAVAGAFGGSVLAKDLAPLLVQLGFGDASASLAFALVVAAVTYLSVVLGELVPKSLALAVADSFALWVAVPIAWLATIARPVVWLLTASSNLVLRGFGDRTDFLESRLTREDLEQMVGDAQNDGSLDAPTGRLVARALEFTALRVRDVMVHRREVATIQRTAERDQLRQVLLDCPHRRLVVIDGTEDQVCGYLLRDDVLAAIWSDTPWSVATLMRPVNFVFEQASAERTLRDLQRQGTQLAVAVDETGGVEGIVTVEDLVEELVGEIFDELDQPTTEAVVRESASTWLLHGSVELRSLARRIGTELSAPSAVRTVAGLCVALAGARIPRTGENFAVAPGIRIEVLDASPRRVRRARLHVEPGTNPGVNAPRRR